MLFCEPGDAIFQIIKFRRPHVSGDRSSPVSAVARARAIIQIEDHETFSGEEIVEEPFAKVPAPASMSVLEISRTVNKENGGTAAAVFRFGELVGRKVEASPDRSAVPSRNVDEYGGMAFESIKLGGRRVGQDSSGFRILNVLNV